MRCVATVDTGETKNSGGGCAKDARMKENECKCECREGFMCW